MLVDPGRTSPGTMPDYHHRIGPMLTRGTMLVDLGRTSPGTMLNDHHLRCTAPPLRGPRADHFRSPQHRSGQYFTDHYCTLPVLVAPYCPHYVTLHWLTTVQWHVTSWAPGTTCRWTCPYSSLSAQRQPMPPGQTDIVSAACISTSMPVDVYPETTWLLQAVIHHLTSDVKHVTVHLNSQLPLPATVHVTSPTPVTCPD
ncbi:hypothetical protein TIFTF001_027140 [Ficus carica]|uniref:Uncharacterized protein n=1 Tax=Ficus carica TaxID=3494 RepID=A0AA88DMD7_FICCA|nr:hypothetical protein TIFTF001_027140 [Ficus carica]